MSLVFVNCATKMVFERCEEQQDFYNTYNLLINDNNNNFVPNNFCQAVLLDHQVPVSYLGLLCTANVVMAGCIIRSICNEFL